MLKALFMIFSCGIILLYLTASWFGWEFANSGSHSMFRMPFFTGFRGGK